MKILICFSLVFLLLISCTRPEDNAFLPAAFLNGKGVFIINEGNFRAGNGSLSFFSYDSSKVYNDIFNRINNRVLGDIPNSIKENGENVFIVVNNSGKIEVVNKKSLLSVKTITGLNSPRHIAFIDNRKAYVTSMYSDSLAVIDLLNNSVSGHINIHRSSEAIEIIGQKAYIAEWVGGKEIMVVNTVTNEVTDSIEVGVEPESMAVDRNNFLWVLCNGGWSGENNAELISINTENNQISKRFIFPDKPANPSCLQVNSNGDILYFIQDGVKSIPVNASALPVSSMINKGVHSFYKIGIDPLSGDIFVTDATDYQHKGYLLHYNPDGTFVSGYQTDINPGLMLFKTGNQ